MEGMKNLGNGCISEEDEERAMFEPAIQVADVVETISEVQGDEPVTDVVHTTRTSPVRRTQTPRIRIVYSRRRSREPKGCDTSKPKRAKLIDDSLAWVDKYRCWLVEDSVPSVFEHGESSSAPRGATVLGEPLERAMVAISSQCARYETEIMKLRDQVQANEGVTQALNEKMLFYDEEKVLDDSAMDQMHFRIHELEASKVELMHKLQMAEQRVGNMETAFVALQEQMLTLEQSFEEVMAITVFCLAMVAWIIRVVEMTQFHL
ncbi:hypothetical protein QVD17_17065 [Tagetes erecta]|uniref:Uncharacterized protein n=1 Tax=Tagetes erecta TaxID=13708 RepID=A0AAD8P135_TARER|nr:hypothetical protein QVD17_17065 [Tagetes erecta]